MNRVFVSENGQELWKTAILGAHLISLIPWALDMQAASWASAAMPNQTSKRKDINPHALDRKRIGVDI